MTQGKSTTRKSKGFTEEERAAMKEHIQEQKADTVDGESAVLAKISEMKEEDRIMAERIHAIVKAYAPGLSPRLWYGMPAYARRDGKVLFFVQPAQKFKTRYATLGFNDTAHLDEGEMWPVAYALKALTAADEARITELVKKAVN